MMIDKFVIAICAALDNFTYKMNEYGNMGSQRKKCNDICVQLNCVRDKVAEAGLDEEAMQIHRITDEIIKLIY